MKSVSLKLVSLKLNLLISLLLLINSSVLAKPPQSILDLKKTSCNLVNCQCGCQETGICTCNNYKAAYQSALKQNKPLLVWVGLNQIPKYSNNWIDYIQCTKPQLDGCTAPCLCIGKPDNQNSIDRITCIPIINNQPIDKTQIISALNPPLVNYQPPLVNYQPPLVNYQPPLANRPMMNFRPMMCSGGG